MKKVLKAFKNHKYLCFLDFEGTQFSHEMIAYGAILVTIDKNGFIVKKKPAVKELVKAKNSVGKFVENLTGISNKDLQTHGVYFRQAMLNLKKYCGLSFKKASFITFGNHDMRILNQSQSYNLDSPKDVCSQIKANYVDFQALLNEFIKDDKNNTMSLTHCLERFKLNFDGEAHDPLNDAVNLARLYDAFMRNKDIVLEGFMKNLSHSSFNPTPVDRVIKKLLAGENVSSKDFEQYCEDYIK